MDAKSITITIVLLLMMISSMEGIRFRRSKHGRRPRARDYDAYAERHRGGGGGGGGSMLDDRSLPNESYVSHEEIENAREPRWTHHPQHDKHRHPRPHRREMYDTADGGGGGGGRRQYDKYTDDDDDGDNYNGGGGAPGGGGGSNDRNALILHEENSKELINEVSLSDYQNAYPSPNNNNNTNPTEATDKNATLAMPASNSTAGNTTVPPSASANVTAANNNNNNSNATSQSPAEAVTTAKPPQLYRHHHHHDHDHPNDHQSGDKYYRKKPAAYKNNAVYFEVGPEYSFDTRPTPDEVKLHLYDPKRKHPKKFNPRVLDLHYESRGERLNTSSLTRPRPYSFERRRPMPMALPTATEDDYMKANKYKKQGPMMMMAAPQRPGKPVNRMHRV